MKKYNTWLALTIVLIGIFLSLISRLPTVAGNSLENQTSLTTDSFDDLNINFELNKTTIGKYSGVLGELSLTNNGANAIGNVEVNFTLNNNYLKFTDTYSDKQTVSLINPGVTTTLNIESILNLTKVEEDNGADVVLLFDSSGSMQDEIDSVKTEFLAITNRLLETIPSLRMGMVVYGWAKYSEYPYSSENNYVEFTSNIDDVLDLINELYADGGTEPWGDAFHLINTWEWREDVPKLAIIIGDEDCDPGNVVGVGYTGSTYNGTQLVEVITSLKEKGVKINSIYTDISGEVVNQFNWIADYTGGNCVNFEEMQSSEDPITLPELIEDWTLNLVREYFVNLTASISWTEFDPPDNDQDYSTSITKTIIIDLASPSITVTTIINEISENEFELQIFAKVIDYSGIKQVNMYWTYDNLMSPLEPTWYFKILTNKIDDTYIEKITDLSIGDHVSFYLEASDTLYNTGKTNIFNLTIATTTLEFRTISEFYFIEDLSNYNFYYNFTDITLPKYISYSINYNTTVGYLWIESMQPITVEFILETDVEVLMVTSEDNYTIYQITSLHQSAIYGISVSGNTSISPIKIRWDYPRVCSDSNNIDSEYFEITDVYRTMLFKINLVASDSMDYLTLISPGALIGKIHIFDEDWNKIATIGTYDPYEIEEGWYYLWVEQSLRTGYFEIYYGPEQITAPDDYYPAATGYSSIVIILGFFFGMIYVQLFKKRRTKKI
ncbi:MAG: VWA domain-containing protein [Candidatus Thorarchaeota archaeon]